MKAETAVAEQIVFAGDNAIGADCGVAGAVGKLQDDVAADLGAASRIDDKARCARGKVSRERLMRALPVPAPCCRNRVIRGGVTQNAAEAPPVPFRLAELPGRPTSDLA